MTGAFDVPPSFRMAPKNEPVSPRYRKLNDGQCRTDLKRQDYETSPIPTLPPAETPNSATRAATIPEKLCKNLRSVIYKVILLERAVQRAIAAKSSETESGGARNIPGAKAKEDPCAKRSELSEPANRPVHRSVFWSSRLGTHFSNS